LQAMSGQWSPDSLRRGAQFFIRLRNYCNHLSACFPGSSDILPRLIAAFKDASQSSDNATRSAAPFYIGQIYASEGLLHDAILNFKQSIAVDPTNLVYSVHLGAALSAAHQYSEGRTQLLQALQIANTDDEKSWIFGELGYTALLSGQAEEAIGQFQEAIRLGTKDDSYRIGLSRAYWKAGRLADARQVLAEVVRKAPDRSDARLYLGLLLSEQGDLSEAISAFKEAVSLAPRNIDYRLTLADALVRHGFEAEATNEFKAVLRLDPGNVPAQQYLSRFSDPANNR
jgi:tetratricopeptide (TPR) repeat protein